MQAGSSDAGPATDAPAATAPPKRLPNWLPFVSARTPNGSQHGSQQGSQHGSPAPRAPTPAPSEHGPIMAAQPGTVGGSVRGSGSVRGEEGSVRDGSVHRREIRLTADGSAHGGRRFFDATQQQPPGAGEQQPQPQPASASDPPGSQRSGHHAIWMVEDGSFKGGASAKQQGEQAGGGGGGGGGGGNGSGSSGNGGAPPGKKGDFGAAQVVIEEPEEKELFNWGTYWSTLPKKLRGGRDTRLPIPPFRDIFWSWLGAFLGILAVCALNEWASPEIDIAFLVGSFGASAVLVFGLLESKLSQPRCFLGGQILSALVGITTRVIIHETWIAGPVGMSLALVLMQLTATVHPPGGATALIASTLPTLPKWHGYSYLVTIAVGSCTMQLIALIINNLDPKRRYPSFWW